MFRFSKCCPLPQSKAYHLEFNRYRFTREKRELSEIALFLAINLKECEKITGALIRDKTGVIEEIWVTDAMTPYNLCATYTKIFPKTEQNNTY